jgi:hypothetical protein
VSPVKYELSFYIPQDCILHSHRRENLKQIFTTEPTPKTSQFIALVDLQD